MPPSPSSGPPWLSESLSPTSPWGMPFEGADACGAGAGAGAGAAFFAGLATGVGAGLAGAVAGVLAAEPFELLPLLPPQLATPTAMRRSAAALARQGISLLRFIWVPPLGLGVREVPRRRAACRRPEGDTFACNQGGSSSGWCLHGGSVSLARWQHLGVPGSLWAPR